MTADREKLAAILEQHLSLYREMSHSELSARLHSPPNSTCLDVIKGTTSNGAEYTIETNIVWDDRSKRHIRVMSDLSTGTSGCLLGVLPIFSSDVSDGFILASDGTFIDD